MATAPNWFSSTDRHAHSFEGECLIADEAAVSDVTYAVTVEERGDKIYARETNPGGRLPRACYNRHIMSEGHFCLGLGYGDLVQDEDSAGLWWANLREFLKIQAVATSTGRWPRHIELDHGQAGVHHKLALEAAATLGMSEEYELALIGEPSWTTDASIRLTRDGTRLVNGRAPCPRGCKKKGHSLLRCECCSGGAVFDLIKNERLRAKTLDEFWEAVKAEPNSVCCGTMIDCPLRTVSRKKESADA